MDAAPEDEGEAARPLPFEEDAEDEEELEDVDVPVPAVVPVPPDVPVGVEPEIWEAGGEEPGAGAAGGLDGEGDEGASPSGCPMPQALVFGAGESG